MTRQTPPLSPELRGLLELERRPPPLAESVRDRVMRRARATVLAGATASHTRATSAPVSRIRWAIAIALTSVASAAVGASAFHLRDRSWGAPSAPPPIQGNPSVTPRRGAARSVALPPAPVTAPGEPEYQAAVSDKAAGPKDVRIRSDREELRLLGRARAAVVRGDFAAALPPITEHARRFHEGGLVEEREALRVKALAGLGRRDEARSAADVFARRFPRSVLLPTLRQLTSGE